jgi:nucleotide-binding universal stress UspA family protein
MSIIVGTDFSETSARAVIAAAALARRMRLPLHVVHSLETGHDRFFEKPRAVYTAQVTQLLNCQADNLRREGLAVDIHVRSSAADDAVLDVAQQADARLIVVAATQRDDKRGLGTRADRVAARAHVPVLIVRDSGPIQAWLRGERPLRVVLGADLSRATEGAMRWLNDLTKLGPCEIVVTHLYWPPLQFQRLGLTGVRSFLDPDAEVTRALERAFAHRLTPFSGLANVRYRLEPNLGRVDARLASLAVEEHADLIVVGSHGRNVASRVREGSVSRGVLRTAPCSAACVPMPAMSERPSAVKVANVLVATDFSDVGNAAIPLAYAVAGAGAQVHLVHVIPAPADGFEAHDIFAVRDSSARAHDDAEARLHALAPPRHDGKCPATIVHVLCSAHPAQAIVQAAERLDADVICLGTHGRTGMSRALFGSDAQSVLTNTRRPVLLARAPLA